MIDDARRIAEQAGEVLLERFGRLAAGEIAEAADDQNGNPVGVGNMGKRGRFHVDAARRPDTEDPFPVTGVVEEDLSRHPRAPHLHADRTALFDHGRKSGHRATRRRQRGQTPRDIVRVLTTGQGRQSHNRGPSLKPSAATPLRPS